MNGHDPSKDIRFVDILRTLGFHFDTVEVRPYGGQVAALLMSEIDPAVDPGSDLDSFIAKWFEIEDGNLGSSPPESYHDVVVAKPRGGISSVPRRVRGFAGRARLARRFRVPGALKRFRQLVPRPESGAD
ncbi:MAG: hypothetical protein ABI682_15400 [Acidobacteriota bacterium]